MVVEATGETPSLTGEFVGETHRVLEHIQTHPTRKQHQKGPIRLLVVDGMTENQQRVDQVLLLPIGPLPHIQHHRADTSITAPFWTPKAPLLYITGMPKQKKQNKTKQKKAKMKEQIKAPEKIQLSNKEIANLSDAQFKILVLSLIHI